MWHNLLLYCFYHVIKSTRFVAPQSPCLSNPVNKIQSDELGINIVTVDYHTLVLCNSVSPTDCAMAEMVTWWPLAVEAKVHLLAQSVQNGTGTSFAVYFSFTVSPCTTLTFHLSTTEQSLQLTVICHHQHYPMATMQTTW